MVGFPTITMSDCAKYYDILVCLHGIMGVSLTFADSFPQDKQGSSIH